MKHLKRMFPSSICWSILSQAEAEIEAAAKRFDINSQHGVSTRKPQPPISIFNNIATITIGGPIERRPTMFGAFFGFTSSELVIEAIRQAVADKEVQSILLMNRLSRRNGRWPRRDW